MSLSATPRVLRKNKITQKSQNRPGLFSDIHPVSKKGAGIIPPPNKLHTVSYPLGLGLLCFRPELQQEGFGRRLFSEFYLSLQKFFQDFLGFGHLPGLGQG